MAASIPTRAPRAADGATRALPFWHYPVALALGIANTFTFAPTPHGGWWQLLTLALLYTLMLRTRGWRGAALTAGAFGFGNFVTGVWWLYVSMHDYGGMAMPLAGGALVLFSLYLALYPALAAALWSYCSGHSRAAAAGGAAYQPHWVGALLFASAWALGEWLRGTIFTGFPWLSIGYAQVEGPFAGYAALVGVYGVGWFTALAAALIAQAFGRTRDLHRMLALPVAAALISIGLALANTQWTQPAGKPLTVRLLQGNVPQQMKFDPAVASESLDLYQRMITGMPADLIVTPETGVAMPIQEAPASFGQAVHDFVARTGSTVLFGVFGATAAPNGTLTNFTNSVYAVGPQQGQLYHYDKHHLVPFGEFIPWGFRWFIDLMKMPLGDLGRGAAVQAPFAVQGRWVMPDICYEDLFGEEVAASIRDNPQAPNLLVNSTNLGWFGNTIALDQHLQISRMRALETGLPMVRSTNTGMTAAIDANGQVIAALTPFQIGSLWVRVQAMQGLTPYVRMGNVAVLVIAVVLLGVGGWRRRAAT